MKKKILLTLTTVFLCLFALGLTASAANYGNLTYEVQNGKVTISGFNTSVTAVTVPAKINGYPVTSIGDKAFKDCSSLTSINLPDSITSIGIEAFYNCSSLTSVNLPDGVTSIGSYAFSNTGYYNNEDNWEDDVLYIGKHLIAAKMSISNKYTVKAGTKTIAGTAFRICDSLESIDLPDSLISIGDHGFYGCSSLTSIDLPDGVTRIGDYAFTGCSSLESIDLPDSLTSIGNYAFAGCSSLESIDLPDSVTSIGNEAFYNTGYYNNEDNWEDDVLYIGKYLIKAKTSISGKYTVKAGTKTIGDRAFYDCSNLTGIDLPDSLTSIGYMPFYNCSSLEKIDLPDGVTSIGYRTFYNCSSLESIDLPDSVTSIGNDAFYECKSLTSIDLPDSITSIGNRAFADCSSLEKIDLSDGLTSIGEQAFAGCSSLASIDLPDGVTSIGNWAFSNCSSLTSIDLPDSVTSIGDFAFYDCSSLTSIDLPDSVTSIGNRTFYNCSSLEKIDLPDSLTSIGISAFAGCSSLEKIDLPDGVTSIGSHAFEDCSGLAIINLPDSLTSIGNYAFKNCSSLKTVYYHGTKEAWKKIIIYYDNSNLINAVKYILYVTFEDDDGTIIEEKTMFSGETIILPSPPSDKDPYTFDYWENYTEGMVATENATFKAVYKYKDYKITAEGLEADVTVTYNSEFNIPPQEKADYNFIGYFTEADGKGEKITDENGNSLKVYDVVGDLKVYPYFEHLYMNKIAVLGEDSAILGDEISREIVFATNKNAQYLIMTVKYPESLILKEIINKDFAEIYKDSETVSDGYKILGLTCLYDYEGDNLPMKETLVPFELKFEVSTDAEVGEMEISIEEAILVGDEDYEITEKINGRLEILPKLAEKIEISGSENIENPEKYIAIVSPEYTTNKEVTWTVSDETVATISQDGVLTPLKNGTVTITATAKDGSGVYAEKTVQVVTHAKLTSLDFGEGVCLDAFDPFKREYTVYVKSDATKITLTPVFSGGVLRPNGSGIWISGRAMDFALNGDETVITLNRENVKDMENNVYTVRVIKYDYATKTDISADGKTFVVTPIYAENGETVILAFFDGDNFIGMQSAVYEGEEITFVTDKEYTMAKVMVWDSLENLSPSGKAEIIE